MEENRKAEGFERERLLVLPDAVQAELAGHPLTEGCYVSDIGCFPQARHHYRERPDGCDSHIVIYCADGEGWIEANGGKSAQMAARRMAVLPAGTPHRYGASADAPWSIFWFHLKGRLVAPLIELYGLSEEPITLTAGRAAQFTEAFERAFRVLENRPYAIATHVHVSHTLRQTLSGIGITAGRSEQQRKRDRYLEDAIRLMADRLGESLTLSDLARHVGLSRQHLIYLFNEETGFPPIDYYLRMKMQRAAQLLDLTDLTLKEIGAAVGLSDPYYFSRLFKKTMGVSPTKYRRVPKG